MNVHAVFHSRGAFFDGSLYYGGAYDDYDYDNLANQKNLTLGKDRELFYASVDLRWLFRTIVDLDQWKSTLLNIQSKVMKYILGPDQDDIGRQNAIEIWSYIRKIQKLSNLKCFQGNIEELDRYSHYQGKLVLLYVEDCSFSDPDILSVYCRLALSDPALGNYINENFIFYPGRTNHKHLRHLLDSAGINHRKIPVLSVLSPVYSISSSTTSNRRGKYNFKEVKRYPIGMSDVKANKILKFLQKWVDSINFTPTY